MLEVVISGPKKNALSSALMGRLLEEVRAAGDAPLLLRGEDDVFSAGLDLEEVTSLDAAGMEAFLDRLRSLAIALFDHRGPTVALVGGHAIAGGCLLALCCDLRIGTSDPRARIGLNEVALGLEFPPPLLGILRHQLTANRLQRVLLGAALHSPTGALELGLLDEVADEPEALARTRLGELAANPPHAYAVAKGYLRREVTKRSPEEERRFCEEVVPRWAAPEARARLLAVLKR